LYKRSSSAYVAGAEQVRPHREEIAKPFKRNWAKQRRKLSSKRIETVDYHTSSASDGRTRFGISMSRFLSICSIRNSIREKAVRWYGRAPRFKKPRKSLKSIFFSANPANPGHRKHFRTRCIC